MDSWMLPSKKAFQTSFYLLGVFLKANISSNLKFYIFKVTWLYGYDSLFMNKRILCIQNGSMMVGCRMKNTMPAWYNKRDGHTHKKLHCNKCNALKLRVKETLVNDTLATCHHKWYIFMKNLSQQIACNFCMHDCIFATRKYICGLFY